MKTIATGLFASVLAFAACKAEGKKATPAPTPTTVPIVSATGSAAVAPTADAAVANAELSAATMEKAAQDADDAMVAVTAEIANLMVRLHAAVQALAAAKTEAEEVSADNQIEALNRELAELERRVEAANAAVEAAAVKAGIKIDQRCLDNPLAAGC